MSETVLGAGAHVARLLYFMAPAYAANMVPPLTRFWYGWNRPICVRWLGSHKTIVGFGAGVAAAVALTAIQARIGWRGAFWSDGEWMDVGLRLGLGAMVGDSVKSLIKRRFGVPPGTSWKPWDQIDFVIGALVFTIGRVTLACTDVFAILVLSAVGHVAVNHVAYWARVRDAKW